MQHKSKKMKRKGILLVVFLLTSMLSFFPSKDVVKASAFTNAKEFCLTYGNNVVYSGGYLYCASSGTENVSAGIRYATIGWKATVYNSAGAYVESAYFQLGGNKMLRDDSAGVKEGRTVYELYKISFYNFKSTFSSSTQAAMVNGSVIFDSVNVIRKNGVLQGMVYDSVGSPSYTGTIYTTLDGIRGAAPWSQTTYNDFATQYNKPVADLYYNLNVVSGNGVGKTSGSGTYLVGSKANLSAEPVNDGYAIDYWQYSDGSNRGNGSTYLTPNIYSNTTIYVYAKGKTYNVTFDGNTSGVSGPQSFVYGVPSSQSYQYDPSGTFTLSSAKPSREGYDFLGWGLNKNDNHIDYEAGGVYSKNHIGDVTLYAKWRIKTFQQTSRYYKQLDGDIWQQFDVRTRNVTYGHTYYNGILPAPTGYHYWRMNKEGWTVTCDKDDRDGYVYYLPNSYTVSYNGNGATSGVMKNGALKNGYSSDWLYYDRSYTIRTNTFKRTGYTFLGWATSKANADKKIVSYVDGSSIRNMTSANNATITLYAVWDPIQYMVVYQGNGATSGGVAPQICTYDQTYTYAWNIGPGFVCESNTQRAFFRGWSLSGVKNGTVYQEGQAFKNLASRNGDIVYMDAQWEPDNNDYTVTVKPNGGTVYYNGESKTSDFTIIGKYGSTFDLKVSRETTNKTKWFDKWKMDDTIHPLTLCDNPDLTFTARIQGDGTLTANWSDEITITVKMNGGVVNGETSDFTIKGKADDPFILDLSFCEYELDSIVADSGCATMDGAYVKSSDYQKTHDYDRLTDVYSVNESSGKMTPNVGKKLSYVAYLMKHSGTVTVNYKIPEAVRIYKITLDDNGGSGGDTLFYEKYGYGYYGDAEGLIKINSVSNIPIKDGFTFLGYYTSKTGGTKVVDETGNIVASDTLFTSNATIYAQWEEYELPNVDYTVEHYLPIINPDTGAESYAATPSATDHCLVKEGKTISPSLFARYDGEFVGYDYSYAKDVNGNKVTSIVVKGNDTIKLYYTGKYFSVAANKSIGISNTSVSGKVTTVVDGVTYYKIGTKVTVTATMVKDYVFTTWTCTAGDVPPSANASYTFLMPGSKVILTAYAKNGAGPDDTIYNITYDLDGGYLEEGVTNPVVYKPSMIVTSSDEIKINNPVKDNATFLGWKSSELNLTTPSKNVVIKSTTTGNIKLTAIWEWNVYKVVLNAPGATTFGTTEYYEKYSVGNYTTQDCTNSISKITIPTKNGYDFQGYFDIAPDDSSGYVPNKYIDANGNILAENTSFSKDNTTDKTTNLYAYWKPRVSKITLEQEEATHKGTEYYYVKYGDGYYSASNCYNAISKIVTPTRKGYDFSGFKNGSVLHVDENGEIKTPLTTYMDVTASAKWTPKDFTISFDCNRPVLSSQLASITHTEKTVTYFTKPMPETQTERDAYIPKMRGWKFEGWYTDIELNTMIFDASGNTLPDVEGFTDSQGRWIAAKDVTVYAKWSLIEYTITYDLNAGSDIDKVRFNGTYKYSVESATFELPTPKREQYQFVGWTGTDIVDGPKNPVEIAHGSIGNRSYVAHWVPIQWQASLSQYFGNTIFGVDPSELTSFANKAELLVKLKDELGLGADVNVLNWESGNAVPLKYMEYGDDRLFLYTNVDSGEFSSITYDLSSLGLGIHTVKTTEADPYKYVVSLPSSIEWNRSYDIKISVTQESDEGEILFRDTQKLTIQVGEFNYSDILYRIRQQ